jgi:RHS repeat-associated protein
MLVTGRAYRIIGDHIGSPICVVDTETGEILQRMSYDTWGRVLADSSPLFQPFGFAGGLHEPETGLTRFGARDYDAATARWTAPDPLLLGTAHMNLYAYANGDPINKVDPEGEVTSDWTLIVRVSGRVYTALGSSPNTRDLVWKSRSINSDYGDTIYLAPNSCAKVVTANNQVFTIKTGEEGKTFHPVYFIQQADWQDDWASAWNAASARIRATINDKILRRNRTYRIRCPNGVTSSRG